MTFRLHPAAPPLFRRHPGDPIVSAAHLPFAANAVFNAGAAGLGDETILLLRLEEVGHAR